jgi:tRNA nucleotidyltransferase (CCA-adding enzyme)
VLDIARTLINAGHETWCVGGAVRDAFLGISHLDWDLATSARPEVVQRVFRRTVPVGLKFGTVGVLDRNGHMHEVTTFRRDFNNDGRHAEVEFGVSLHDDLARRDFTINAMAWHPVEQRLEDPFGGREDLERGLVRAVGIAEERFHEDRLRALRAIRFAARFDFAIEAETWEAIQGSAPHMGRLSAERVKQELEKTMEQVVRPSKALRLWQSSGAFTTLIPSLATVPERALLATDALALPGLSTRPLRRTLRFAALFSAVEPRMLAGVLKSLKFSNVEITALVSLAGNWHAIGDAISQRLLHADVLPDRDVRRWVARVGRLRVAAFSRLAAAMWWADRELGIAAPAPRRWRVLHKQMLTIAFRDPLESGDLAIDGDDLRRAGVMPGPLMGRVLHALTEFVLEDPTRNAVDTLSGEARRLASELST